MCCQDPRFWTGTSPSGQQLAIKVVSEQEAQRLLELAAMPALRVVPVLGQSACALPGHNVVAMPLLTTLHDAELKPADVQHVFDQLFQVCICV